EALVMNRRQQASESELRQQLLKVTEVRFDPAKAQEMQLTEKFAASTKAGELFHAPDAFASWPELHGLPFRAKTECRLDEPAAKNLQALSRTVRSMLTEVDWIQHPISRAEAFRSRLPRTRERQESKATRGEQGEDLAQQSVANFRQIVSGEERF